MFKFIQSQRDTLIITIGVPLSVALLALGLGSYFRMPLSSILFIVGVSTGVAITFVIMKLRSKLESRKAAMATMQAPGIEVASKPSAAISSYQSHPPTNASTFRRTLALKPVAPFVAIDATTSAQSQMNAKPDQTRNEIKEVRDILSKMQSQMDLISEALLSSAAYKNEINENSPLSKGLKASGPAEDPSSLGKHPSPSGSVSKEDAMHAHSLTSVRLKEEDSMEGVNEEVIGSRESLSPRLSPKIKIPVSRIQEDAETVGPQSQTWGERQSATEEDKGLAQLIQLRKELQRMREAINSSVS